jgi:hypothetical protein
MTLPEFDFIAANQRQEIKQPSESAIDKFVTPSALVEAWRSGTGADKAIALAAIKAWQVTGF